ncbi:MAG: efflux RND transporter periplasmic adaptor subunit [Bacteroidota bacterium]
MTRLLLLTLVLVLSACGGGEEADTSGEVSLRPVRYQTIGFAQNGAQHTYSGVAQADQLSKLSFRVGGTIRSVNVKLGDRVRRGQLIATIDPIDYSIQADQASASEKGAEANLQSAETQLINARSNYYRIEKLYENNSVPLNDFEQAKSAYESAQSSYEAAQTQVTSAQKQSQSARNQVSYTRLTAPFNGVITAINAEVNELTGSGTPIAELSSEAKPEVRVGIPENFISGIKAGQKVGIRFSVLPGEVFTGTVSEVSYAAGSSPTYPAIIQIDNASSNIRPGMAATVAFGSNGDAPAALVCPVKALARDMEGNFVYVLEKASDEAYVAKRQTVEVGEMLTDGFIIKEGLAEGQIVATAGLKSILDGMQVKLME